jgi:hypothetical protein
VITRWVRAPIGDDGRPQGFDHATMGFRLDFGDGTGLYEVEFNSMEQLAAAQAGQSPQFRILPSFNAPIAKLPAGVQAWLNSKLQTPANQISAGDTVLDALRKLRSEFGGKFNVDSPY